MVNSPRQWLCDLLRGDVMPLRDFSESAGDALWDIARNNGVLALAYHVASIGWHLQSFPEAFRKRLVHHYRMTAASELLRERDLLLLIDRLAEIGLDPIILKGTALAHTHYAYPHLRARCDIDFILPGRADAERCWDLLKQHGFRREDTVNGHYIPSQYSASKEGKVGSVQLDVHWLANNYYYYAAMFPYPELFAHRVSFELSGRTIYCLGPVHALLFALVHRMTNLSNCIEDRLIWLYDLHLLAGSFDEQQWQVFVEWCIKKKAAAISLDGLTESQTSFGTVIPKTVLTDLKRAVFDEPLLSDLYSQWRIQLLSYQALPGWRERLLMLEDHLFPDGNYMLHKYATSHRFMLPWLYMRRAVFGMFKTL